MTSAPQWIPDQVRDDECLETTQFRSQNFSVCRKIIGAKKAGNTLSNPIKLPVKNQKTVVLATITAIAAAELHLHGLALIGLANKPPKITAKARKGEPEIMSSLPNQNPSGPNKSNGTNAAP